MSTTPSAPAGGAEVEETAPSSGDTVIGRAAASPSEATLEPLETANGRSAATQPVAPRPSRRRWAIALGVVFAVVALSLAAAFTLSSAGQTSLTAGAVPKSSLAFATLRTDLPGDQQQKVAELLAHFPGFADQSLLEQSLGETLDKVVRSASNGKHDYTTEIKPWLGGEIGMAITRAPTTEKGTDGGLIVIQAKDAAQGEAWVRGLLASAPQTTAAPDQTYAGATLHVYSHTVRDAQQPEQAAVAVTGQLILVGDVESVKAGLDAKQQGGLDSTDQYKTASRSVPGDHLATIYVDTKQFVGTALRAAEKASPSAAAAIPASLADNVPPWAWMAVRAESNGLVVDGAAPRPKGVPAQDANVSTLAPKLPGSTVAAVEGHDIGTMLKTALNEASSNPATKDAANQIRQALAMMGGVDHLLGWIGDAAVVVTHQSSTTSGGLVIQATDQKAAQDVLSQVRNLLTVLSGQGVEITDETYNGTTITTLDLTALASTAMGQTAPKLPAGTKIELSFATRGDIVAIGAGDAFVKSVLDVKAGSSLADSAAYKAAIEVAGSSNTGQAYVDIGSVMQAVEPLLSGQNASRYTADYKPYVEHLAAIAVARQGGDPSTARFVVTVK